MSVFSMFPFGGMGGGATEGMFCWAKYNGNPTAFASVSISANTTTLTDVGNGEYSIKTASTGAGWGKHYIRSEFVDTTANPFKFSYTSHPTAYLSNILLSFSDTEATQLAGAKDGIYLVYDNTIQHYKNGASVGNVGTHRNGDKFELVAENGTISVYQNGNLLYSETTTMTSACAFITMYDTSATFGTFKLEKVVDAPILGYALSDDLNAYPQDGFHTDGYYYKLMENDIAWDERGQYAWAKMESADTDPMGYVIGNEEDAYPNEGFADDGYYYVKVGATKVGPKYANGAVSQTSNIVSVSGLGFKPISVTVYCGNVYNTGQGSCAWGIVDESGTSKGYYVRGVYGGDASFSATDDGFSIKATNAATSGTSSYEWHAIGI